MKKFLALTLALLMALSLVACGSQPAADDNQDADSTPVDTSNYVKTDYNPTKPMTKGINGEDPASLADFSFTDEELQQLKATSRSPSPITSWATSATWSSAKLPRLPSRSWALKC